MRVSSEEYAVNTPVSAGYVGNAVREVWRLLWTPLDGGQPDHSEAKCVLADIVDCSLEAEHQAMARLALADILPRASSFDTGWAS